MPTQKRKLVYSTRSDAQLNATKTHQSPRVSLPPQQQTIYLLVDRKQRKGKTVTICRGFQLTPTDLKDLEKKLKQECGAGGTSKGDEIEIQGDHRDKIFILLETLNYKVKRSGG